MSLETIRPADAAASRARVLDRPHPPADQRRDGCGSVIAASTRPATLPSAAPRRTASASRRRTAFSWSIACAAIVCAAVALSMAGCAGTGTTPSGYAAYTQSDLVVGTGTEAATGKTVTMNYTGWVYDSTRPNQRGAQFDSTTGATPFSFVLGSGQVIGGWEKGVPGMKIGGVRQLVIPPSLAYGGSRKGPIPPNATLIFEISLVDVQ